MVACMSMLSRCVPYGSLDSSTALGSKRRFTRNVTICKTPRKRSTFGIVSNKNRIQHDQIHHHDNF
ncbi:hypothetical protein BCIN_15g03830 [Botrytis cinerea B05.10]|uniref:Uncharacterized protein n=1 Tax=Botryotinia fuckeliana (strain B05.10) TaxID=332648 RepID=A0A384K525_BOTFB|nr:hypothetical protein BCIN_15g03830 [Botrytis cinerea B05.10]ATZ57861.1 hypothetical protein BCIN_15g03830 [Botrytis cinerea B05.10]